MTRRSPEKNRKNFERHPRAYPFTAIVGQDEMKLALLLNVISPAVGGLLITGHRGTGKSTAVRSLAELLPPIETVEGCLYNCDPRDERSLCDDCRSNLAGDGKLRVVKKPVPVVELPLGATEDRVCGTIDFERALREGARTFEPGLLARANRGFLYIDEVNLLEDHLVDLLLDVAATGRNRVEREGISVEHPARFVLVGSANPEEGELRPQLLDRFGLCVEIKTVLDAESRVLIIERREAFESDPELLLASAKRGQDALRRKLSRASSAMQKVETPRELLLLIAELCSRLGVDGHRGDITIARASRALAALEGRGRATAEDARRVAALALRHRLRRDPFERGDGAQRIEREAEDVFGKGTGDAPDGDGGGSVQGARGGGSKEESSGGNESSSSTSRGARAGSKGDVRDVAGEGDGEPQASAAPTVDTFMEDEALGERVGPARMASGNGRGGRGRGGLKRSSESARGRYAGATELKTASARPALDATLRAAARARSRDSQISSSETFVVAPSDLRYKRFRRPSGTLYIFAIDASGSMALNRIGQAKGALSHLLRRSYQRRDRIALLSFRGRGAELHLAPCNSPARASALLDSIPVGGATPLAAALARALEVTRRTDPLKERVRLVVFTDGRANVPLKSTAEVSGATLRLTIEDEINAIGASLKSAGVETVVVDTRRPYTCDEDGKGLAVSLGGLYLRLPARPGEAALEEGFRRLTQ